MSKRSLDLGKEGFYFWSETYGAEMMDVVLSISGVLDNRSLGDQFQEALVESWDLMVRYTVISFQRL